MAQKKRPKTNPNTILNRRARFDYALGEEIVAGLVLTGLEVRAARDKHVQLKGAFVTVRNDELWLNNASFTLKLNEKGGDARTIDTSVRKLLASRKQIDSFIKGERAHDEVEMVGVLNQFKEQDLQDILAYLTSIQVTQP